MRRTLPALLALLAGCSILPKPAPTPKHYDLGPPPQGQALPPLPAGLVVENVSAPEWLQSSAIHYRLAYDDPNQLRSYAQHRWVAPPPELFQARLGQMVAQARAASPPAVGSFTLNVTLEAFQQVFESASAAHVDIRLRARLDRPGKEPATQVFTLRRDSPPNAPGAVRALATLTDTAIRDLLWWAAGEMLKP